MVYLIDRILEAIFTVVTSLNFFRDLGQSLNLDGSFSIFEMNLGFHTGIKRDTKNSQIWRRSSDGTQVNLDGWVAGFPGNNAGQIFLYWNVFGDPYHILNNEDTKSYFICEY